MKSQKTPLSNTPHVGQTFYTHEQTVLSKVTIEPNTRLTLVAVRNWDGQNWWTVLDVATGNIFVAHNSEVIQMSSPITVKN